MENVLDLVLNFRTNEHLTKNLKELAKKNNITPCEYIRQIIQDAYLNHLQHSK